MSAERAYVHADVYDELVAELQQALDREVLGASFTDAATIGTLTSARQLETVQRHVDDAVSKGATVVYGGKARPELGPFFFEPTILEGVAEDMECYAAETFGPPVLSLYKVNSDEEAIARANDTSYGLAASVWSGSERHAWNVAAGWKPAWSISTKASRRPTAPSPRRAAASRNPASATATARPAYACGPTSGRSPRNVSTRSRPRRSCRPSASARSLRRACM